MYIIPSLFLRMALLHYGVQELLHCSINSYIVVFLETFENLTDTRETIFVKHLLLLVWTLVKFYCHGNLL